MTWFDILILIIIGASAVRGFITGIVMQVATLAGLILGILFAGQAAEIISPTLAQLFDESSKLTSPISFIIAFCLILLVVTIIGRIINSMVKVVQLGILNRIAGGIFCAVKWLLICSILTTVVTEIDISKSLISKTVRDESHTYPLVISFAEKIIPYLKFEKVTQVLKETQQLPTISL